MDGTRRIRRELGFEMAKLNGLQRSVDLTVDDASTKALATEIRKQAGICLDLLDKYQLNMPGRIRSYAESGCQSLRDDLRQTEMHFRDVGGEFERHVEDESERYDLGDWRLGDFYFLDEDFDGEDSATRIESKEPHWPSLLALSSRLENGREKSRSTSRQALSRSYFEAHNRQDLDGLMDLVDDDVEFKLAFDPPLKGKAAVRSHYEQDWADHKEAVVNIKDVFETDGKIAVEIHVDSGPPSKVLYNGVVVHHWNEEGRLARYQLYVDEVIAEKDCAES